MPRSRPRRYGRAHGSGSRPSAPRRALVWLAYAAQRTGPNRPEPQAAVRPETPPLAVAPGESGSAARAIGRAAPGARDAATDVPRTSRAPAPRVRRRRVERFEPLYPGDPLADLDAVHLVRVSVPRSALATPGLAVAAGSAGHAVELDAMVGPDGDDAGRAVHQPIARGFKEKR